MIDKLYDKARSIPEALKYTNKYTFLGYNNILEIKYLDVNDVLSNFKSIKIASYISTNGQVLLFPNRIDGTITDLFIRPLHTKESPLKLGAKSVPYNIGSFNPNFKYGDVLILVEGIADLGGLKFLKSDLNIISMQSNKLPTEDYNIIAGITNKVVILTDNDKAGDSGARQMIRDFRKHNVTAKHMKQYSSLKDTGDILDKVMQYMKTKDSSIKEELELIKMYYINTIYTQFN